MLLPGHDDLLTKAVSSAISMCSASPNKVETIQDLLCTSHYHRSTEELLQKGLHYPDEPCGKRNLTSRGRVRFINHKTCSFFKLTRLLAPGMLGAGRFSYTSEAFVSHKLTMAHIHSMSYNPRSSVMDVRRRILTQAAIYAVLSIQDISAHDDEDDARPCSFWLGQLIHMIQDSYSPAHVLRTCSLPLITTSPSKLLSSMHALTRLRLLYPEHIPLEAEVDVGIIEEAARRSAMAPRKKGKAGVDAPQQKTIPDTALIRSGFRPRTEDDVSRAINEEMARNGMGFRVKVGGSKREDRYARNLFLLFYLYADVGRYWDEHGVDLSMSQKSNAHTMRTSVGATYVKALRPWITNGPRNPDQDGSSNKKKEVVKRTGNGSTRKRAGVDELHEKPMAHVKSKVDWCSCTEIVTFNYYLNQSTYRHTQQDTLSEVKRHGMKKHAIHDSAIILGMYHTCLKMSMSDIDNPASSAASASSASSATSATSASPTEKLKIQRQRDNRKKRRIDNATHAFVYGVIEYLSRYTYAVKEGCEDLSTGFDLDYIIDNIMGG